MTEVEFQPAPVGETAEPRLSKFYREEQAFRRLFGELLKTHPGKYVAIHDGEVVAVGDEMLPTAREAWSKVGYVDLYVDLVSEEPPVVERIPHFREVRWA